MALNIGLTIWKEMKSAGITRDELAERTNISRNKIDKVIQSTSIDTELLVRISLALRINFFDYYSLDLGMLEDKSAVQIKTEFRNQLVSLMDERDALLSIIDEFKTQQSKMMSILDKSR